MGAVKVGYRYRLYPGGGLQRNELARLFGCVRVTWNVSLAWQYSERRAGLGLQGYGQLSKHLTQMKRDGSYMWLNDVSCVPTQQTLRHLGCAWDMHFKSMAPDWEGPYVEEPRFKKRGKRQTAEFTRSAHWRIRHEPDGRYGYLRLPGVTGELRFRWSRDLPSGPSGLTISLERSGEYMVSFNVMRNEPDSWPEPIHEWCGIDLGLISLAAIASQDKGGATHMEISPIRTSCTSMRNASPYCNASSADCRRAATGTRNNANASPRNMPSSRTSAATACTSSR